jgi:hypothetical protein
MNFFTFGLLCKLGGFRKFIFILVEAVPKFFFTAKDASPKLCDVAAFSIELGCGARNDSDLSHFALRKNGPF